jgi:hypothetical protein
MKPAEVKRIYIAACQLARSDPQQVEEKLWANAFAYLDARDLDTAIGKYFEHSRFMPRVSELLPLVKQAEGARTLAGTQRRFLFAWRCQTCGAGLCGFHLPNANTLRHCSNLPQRKGYARGEICGGDMSLVYGPGREIDNHEQP